MKDGEIMATVSDTLKMFDQGWNVPHSMDIFQTSGVERMSQEIESAKRMLQDMQAVQKQMAAADMEFLPPNAAADIMSLNQRVIQLGELFEKAVAEKEKLAEKADPSAISRMNSAIEDIRRKLHQAVQEQNKLNDAMKSGDLGSANDAYRKLIRQIEKVEVGIRDNIQEQEGFNLSTQNVNSNGKGFLSRIKRVGAGLFSAYVNAQSLQAAISASDTYMSTQARLGLIVDEGQTVEQLQNRIFAAAQRARGDFVSMANNVSELGLLAGDAFSNTNEIVAFAELMQKSFQIGGSSVEEQISGMHQLTQAMAAGKLQGDEFQLIMEKAPMLADAIAKFTGKSKGELKEMSAEGMITADIIKGALFAAADDINKKFETVPKTFGDVSQQFKNDAFRAFEGVFKRLNEWLNSAQGSMFVQSLTIALQYAAVAADWLIRGLQFGIPIVIQGFLMALQAVQNLGIIIAGLSPIIFGVIAAWLTYLAITKSLVLWTRLQTIATAALTIVQEALNFVMKMNPIVRIITIVIGLITAFAALMEMSKGLKQVLSDVFGFIVDMAEKAINSVILIINEAIRGINSVAGFFADLLGVEAVKIKEIAFKADFQKFKESGQDLIENFSEDKIKEKFGLDRFEEMDAGMDTDTFDFSQWQTNSNINKVNEVGKIRDTVDIGSEDLKMMRELAEMNSIQNFVTLTPTVQVTTGPISKEADVDKIISRIETALTEQIAFSAQGVYGV